MDYAATTPLDQDVLKDMMPYFSDNFGNPSSVYEYGEIAKNAIVKARQDIADFLGVRSEEIIFTSGATEGNNMVIKGITDQNLIKERYSGRAHIIVGTTEHDCILESVKKVLKNSDLKASFVSVNHDGRVSVDNIKNIITPETILVSIMYANNETGAINPIQEISEMIKEFNLKRKNKIYFHTDAAQALNYLDCNPIKLGVDMMTISSHKIYGPKGIGALYIKKGTVISRFIDGGDQEYKLRAGTHNVPGIVGFGSAVLKLREQNKKNEEIEALRDKLIDGILSSVSNSALNGSRENRLLNNVNIRFEGVEGEAVLMMLNKVGVYVSTGSACAAKSLAPSHVLKAMGLTDLDAHSSIRFSLGRETVESDINYVISIMPNIIEKLRKISGSITKEVYR